MTHERRTNLFHVPRRSLEATEDDFYIPPPMPTMPAAAAATQAKASPKQSPKLGPTRDARGFVFKSTLQRANTSETVDDDSDQSGDEEQVPQSANANIASRIQLRVNIFAQRRLDFIKLSPYTVVHEGITQMLKQFGITGDPADWCVCKTTSAALPTESATAAANAAALAASTAAAAVGGAAPTEVRRHSSGVDALDGFEGFIKNRKATNAELAGRAANAVASSSSSTSDSDERQWLNPQQTFYQQHVKSGDELTLKNAKDKMTVQVVRPPHRGVLTFNHDFLTTVRSAVVALLATQTPDMSHEADKYGFYYALRGIWLDSSRTLEYYDIDPTHILELRLLSQEFLVKVRLPDAVHQNTVMLKVVKTQLVWELVNMITVKVNIEGVNQYALYHVGRSLWLDESRSLADYEIEPGTVLEYKCKFRAFTVHVFPDGRGSDTSEPTTLSLLIDHNAFLGDVLELIRQPLAISADDNFGLFDQNGELLRLSDTAETITRRDHLDFKRIPLQFTLTPSYDISAKVSVELDNHRPVSAVLTAIGRRLGLRTRDIASLSTSRGQKIVMTRSLYQQGISSADLIVVEAIGKGWEPVPATLPSEAATAPPVQPAADDDGVSIWDEPRDSESNIQFEGAGDAQIVAAGTLNKLVERLTEDSSHDLQYIKTFLLTYQSFTSTSQLLRKLADRFHVPRPAEMAYHDFDRTYRKTIRLRVLIVIKQWVERFSSDFLEGPGQLSPLAHEMLRFAREVLLQEDPNFARQIINTLFRLLDAGPAAVRSRRESNAIEPPPPKLPQRTNPKLFDYHPLEIARQLTIYDFELFASMKAPEFLRQAFNKATAEQKAPNILRVSHHFNRTVLWVVKTILAKGTIRKRAARFAQLVEVADHLHALKNFSTLMAFVAGFNNAAIMRLKHTKSELPAKALKRLEALENVMSSESSYKEYRQQLQNSQPPLIPYIGVHLADLTFIDDGNRDRIGNGLINFAKRRLDYTVISQLQMYQAQPYNLVEYADLRNYLLQSIDDSEAIDVVEKRAYARSLELEPRGVDRSTIL